MKKLIGWILSLAVIAGLIFIFVANNFAMITIFTHNQEKSLAVVNASIEKFNEESAKAVEYTFEFNDGETKTTGRVKSKTVTETIDSVETSYRIFEAEVKKDDVTTKYWYDGKTKLLYTKQGDTKTKTSMAFYGDKGAEAYVTGSVSAMLVYDINDVTLSEDQKIKSAMSFSFKPFYFIGERFKLETDGYTGKIYVDVVGNFRGISIKAETYGMQIKIYNTNAKMSVAQLSAEQASAYELAA